MKWLNKLLGRKPKPLLLLDTDRVYDEGKSAETRAEYEARPNVCDWCGYRVVDACVTRTDTRQCVNA